jgi:DNA-binding Lrp family transcriptional regulator
MVSNMNSAFVMINTVADQMERVLEDIKEIEFVEEAYMLYGIYDIIAVIKGETADDLKQTILRIRTVKGVTSSLTLNVVS